LKNKEDISVKSWLLFLAVSILGLAILVKVFVIQIGQADKWEIKGQNFEQQERVIPAVRGQILAEDGSLLATSVPEYHILWDSKTPGLDSKLFDEKLDSLAAGLAKVFDNRTKQGYIDLFRDAQRNGARYASVKKHVTFPDLKEVQRLPILRKSKYKSGFIVERSDIRKRPFGLLAQRTIGLFRETASVGVERAFNQTLAGQDGIQLQEKLAGNVWKPISDDFIQEPIPGLDVVMAINVNLQDIAETTLKNQLVTHSAEWGCAVLMEVETGYIKAIANLTYDEDEGEYLEGYNHAVGTKVEPGSTFKLPALMAALESGVIELTDSIDTGKGLKKFYGSPIRDSNWDHGGNGKGTVEEIFEWSSNVGIAEIIDSRFKSKKQDYLDALAALGINQPLGITLIGEPAPNIYRNVGDDNWSGISHIWMSIGYECEQTPLQTLSLYNAVANGGKMVRPSFITGYQRNNKIVESKPPVVLREAVASRQTIKDCQKMLEGVCKPDGTADYIFKDCNYDVAGKTGTAWLNAAGGYIDGHYRASFVGYFPADKPKYSCIVVVNDPTAGSYYGSSVAAPVFKRLADHIYATQLDVRQEELNDSLAKTLIPISKGGYHADLLAAFSGLGISVSDDSNSDWVGTQTGKTNVALKAMTIEGGKVPNVCGMGLKDALFLLENCGLKVQIEGRGMVKTQSIHAGSAATRNETITLKLS
jgi:cell division protein FtsI (penicillin-binding protein 3)